MRNRYVILSSLITLFLLVNPSVIHAQSVTGAANSRQAARLTALQTQADTAISLRLASLNTAATRINGLAKLSNTLKTQYTGQINTDISGLTALKTKIDADTDLPTLRADYKSIFSTYRVYAVFIPQLHLLTASDTMDVTSSKLSQFATLLQTRVQAAGNTPALTALLTDMQTKLTDANTQYTNVQTQVTPLTPQSYDANTTGTQTILRTARSSIQTGSTDLKTAWADAKQILVALKVSTVLPSPSVTQ